MKFKFIVDSTETKPAPTQTVQIRPDDLTSFPTVHRKLIQKFILKILRLKPLTKSSFLANCTKSYNIFWPNEITDHVLKN